MPSHDGDRIPHEERGAKPRGAFSANDPVVTIVALCWVLAAAALVPQGSSGPVQLPEPRCTINPNRAPWWELTALPGIGEARAKEIVRYREAALADPARDSSVPVFQSPDDLDRICGIGPKTLRDIAAELDFGS